MRVLVIGAGAVGSAIARELASVEQVMEVLVSDTSARALTALAKSTPSKKLSSFQVSARDQDAMIPLLEKSDCVVVAMGNDRNPDLARLAVENDCHYVDLGALEREQEPLWELDEMARERGKWIVPGCGLAPGLVNMLCLHGVDRFDEPRAAFIRVGAIPMDPKPPFEFSFSWSAEKVLNDYTGPVRLIENGVKTDCQPLTRLERISFGDQYDHLEAFCTAGGLSSLPDRLEGRIQTLDLKTIRWPGHADRMRFLIGLGFAEEKSLDVRTHLTYRDVLVRRMRQRLGGHQDDVVLMRIAVQGRLDGRDQTLCFQMIEPARAELGINAMKYCTAIPAVVVALELASGRAEGGGAAPPEGVIQGSVALDAFRARGLRIEENWHDGLFAVAQTV
ncbi:MAG: lysine 6-dehydrogenase [Rhodothermales bacterium]|jgi:lysine 6-dehydrogenase